MYVCCMRMYKNEEKKKRQAQRKAWTGNPGGKVNETTGMVHINEMMGRLEFGNG